MEGRDDPLSFERTLPLAGSVVRRRLFPPNSTAQCEFCLVQSLLEPAAVAEPVINLSPAILSHLGLFFLPVSHYVRQEHFLASISSSDSSPSGTSSEGRLAVRSLWRRAVLWSAPVRPLTGLVFHLRVRVKRGHPTALTTNPFG